jgi:hypothetical protein
MSYDRAQSCGVECDRSAPRSAAGGAPACNDVSDTLLLGMGGLCVILLRQKITKARKTVHGHNTVCAAVRLGACGARFQGRDLVHLDTNLGAQQWFSA